MITTAHISKADGKDSIGKVMTLKMNDKFDLLFFVKMLTLGIIMSLSTQISAISHAEASAKTVKPADRAAVDLIVHGRYVVTMVPENPVIENGAVAVRGGVIVAVGSGTEIMANFTAEKIITGQDRALMPGLINGHTHTAMVMFRGMADDLAFMTWLKDYIFPMEGQFVDPEFIEAGMNLACLEMIRGGTTSFVDMYFYPDRGGDVIESCGLRAILASPSIDYPSPGFKGWTDSFASAVSFVKNRTSKSGRVTPAFGPHSPYTVSPEHLAELSKIALDLDAPISIHLAEDRAELDQIKDRYDSSPILHVERLGLLKNKLIAAHVVHPTTEEIKLLAKYNVGVIHNPTSNMKTAAGVSPVPEMLKQGVRMGLGTDGAASNNDLNMWEEIRLAALLHKGVSYDPTVMSAPTVLTMATIGGAQAIGLDHLVGDIVVGKRADLIQMDLSGPHMTPLYDVISHLVYAVSGSDVVTTIVDGAVLMENHKVITLDAEKVRAKANQIAARITEALKKSEN